MPIRWRLALLCAAATLLVLAGAGVVFLRQLQSGLDGNLDTTLRSRAATLIAQVVSREGPDFPDTTSSPVLRGTDTLEQILTADARVVQSSDGLAGRPLLTPQQAAAALRGPVTLNTDVTLAVTARVGSAPAVTEDHLVRLLAAPLGRAGQVVVVGVNRDVVTAAVTRAGQQLLALGLVVLVLAGVGAYLLARAALRPVERMRAQADDLGANDDGAALAVPRTRDEVSHLAVTMNALLTRLHAALARERSFVADAGHELRTPLTVLRGELELARRPGRSRGELAATVAVASLETDRLIRLSEDLLLLSQAQEGPFLRLTPADLSLLGGAAVQAGQTRARELGVSLELDAAPSLIVLADGDRVRQALDNLVSNALRVSPPGGTVTLAVRAQPGSITVTVRDDGPGFPPEFLPVAFERFRRADTARTRGGGPTHESGSGLGLAIVRSIAVAHGGGATARNRAQGGAAVTLTLPTHGPGPGVRDTEGHLGRPDHRRARTPPVTAPTAAPGRAGAP